jgi:hypothetical protein
LVLAVVTLAAAPALTAVQVRFCRAPKASPETPASKAAFPPLYLHGIFWGTNTTKKGSCGCEELAPTKERVLEDVGRLAEVLGKSLRRAGAWCRASFFGRDGGRGAQTAEG